MLTQLDRPQTSCLHKQQSDAGAASSALRSCRPTAMHTGHRVHLRSRRVRRCLQITKCSSAQDDPINYEEFKRHQELPGDFASRLYVLHAHSYFPYSTDEEKAKANKFRAAVQSKFAGIQGIKIADITPEAVGPHPRPEFETAFTKHHLAEVLPWFTFNRPGGFSILFHPFTSNVVEDHNESAMWLGKNLGADLQPLIDLQKQIADEVKDGKDESALLWPFVYSEINNQSHLV